MIQGDHFRDPVLRIRRSGCKYGKFLTSLNLVFFIYKMTVKIVIFLGG